MIDSLFVYYDVDLFLFVQILCPVVRSKDKGNSLQRLNVQIISYALYRRV
jgi:hypothetical protein